MDYTRGLLSQAETTRTNKLADLLRGATGLLDQARPEVQNRLAGLLSGELANKYVGNPLSNALGNPQPAPMFNSPQNKQIMDMAMSLMPMGIGMIRTSAGSIPETRGDVNKLADRFARLLDDAGVNYSYDKSSLSPARYFEFDNPSTLNSVDGLERYKVRISDHRNVHGADFSVDPVTGKAFEEMVKEVQGIGVPIKNRVTPIPKQTIDDATLEKVWGGPLSTAPQAWIKSQRENLVLSPKGYWTESK